MTEKLYLNDAYLKECDSRITGINEKGVILDRTVFYASGGGQPGDSGKIIFNNREFMVRDTVKEGDDVLHIVDNREMLEIESQVRCLIDWERRYIHMKYHGAIHLIDAVVNMNPDYEGLITGSQIYDDKARVDFSMENFSQEIAQNVIDRTNSVINENHEILVKYMPGEEAVKIKNLARTEPGRQLIQKLETVRIVEIVGVDQQADGGTHVRNTSEIGTILLQKIENKGKRNKRMYFTLE
ncbi:MAG: alanyl-tRNA editing protein [Candidatus Thermoplasmatota archaeon]|jgi:misacylated tRNA(Ala) deacylase|nr:alanyl-tRNA editing protein [Candidatus Thermoplasmatota archaeon]MCL5791112.1 alanyl-tRNA editing protein [Candidatus Thermoplasmatota archaeon]